jgi:hypothetical protein
VITTYGRRRPAEGADIDEVIAATWASVVGVRADEGAVVGVVETTNDLHRRRVFLSFHAAHRALERARDRGLDAGVVLCELIPVGGAR